MEKQIVSEARRKYQYKFNKKRRERLVKEHKCIACGKKVKPVTIFHTRCPRCLEKMKKSREKSNRK